MSDGARLVKRGDALFVEQSYGQYGQPLESVCLWRVDRIVRGPYGVGFPEHGDPLSDHGCANGQANYHGKGYSLHFAANATAVETHERAIPCPKVRKGIETRWADGRWQKYSKREGWITA